MPATQAWIQNHIESRIYRGTEWRERLSDHASLAKDFRYVRILGDGFRPVSIGGANPCGHLKDMNGKQVKKCNGLAEAMEKAKGANGQEHVPGADKPEHRVQASLIREALLEGLRLHQAFEGFDHEFDELIFVTDELSLEAGEKKLRADMIAVGGKSGTYFPVFIELKNKRLISKLKLQLDNAVEMLWENQEANGMFAKFLSAVAGVDVDTSVDAKRMIIWPRSTSGNESEGMKQVRRDGLLIAGFEPSSSLGRSYAFRA